MKAGKNNTTEKSENTIRFTNFLYSRLQPISGVKKLLNLSDKETLED